MPATRHAPLVLLFALAACPQKPPPSPDAGALPDICNSQSEAQSNPACQLVPGQQAKYYLDHLGKQLWLELVLPPGTTAASLLTLQAGYSPEVGSPVQLAVSVLTASGQSLARAADDHDPAPPGVLDVTAALGSAAAPGQPLFLLFTDDGNQHFDAREPFFVTVNVAADPDPNQPGVPTVVSLQPGSNGVSAGAASGVLSTAGRHDEFAVTVPAGTSRPLLYFSITVPALPDGGVLAPPIQYLMSYTLYDCGGASAQACAGDPPASPPTGSIAATDHEPNVYVPVDLATARLVNAGDTYVIDVSGWQDPTNSAPVPGDPRAAYSLAVELMSDVDPNDLAQPTAVPLGGLDGPPATLQGRLSYVSAADRFRIDVPPSGKNTRLHYRIVPGSGPGRFPPLPGSPIREATVAQPVSASGGADPVQACETDNATCPNDLANAPAAVAGLVQADCESDGGPLCLLSYRQELGNYDGLSNFEGVLAVPAGGSPRSYVLSYDDRGGLWADDVPYTLTVQWQSESPDKQDAYHATEATAVQAGTLAVDGDPAAGYPNPPSGATLLSGSITTGNTLLGNLDPTSGQGVHAANDYDAVPSSLDVYELDFPAPGDGGVPPVGASWELQWQVEDTASGGTRPYDIAVAPELCDASGSCVPTQQTADPFAGLDLLGWTPGPVTPWWSGAHLAVWSLADDGGWTTVTAGPAGCFCFEPQDLAGGKLYLKVVGVDRTSYADAPYQIRMALTSYPQADGNPNGESCPVGDGGIPDGGTQPVPIGCQMAPQAGP